MPNTHKTSIVGGFDYDNAFGFTRIFRSFKIATQPGKLAVALFMIVVLFVVGLIVDGVFGGGRVYIGEFAHYVTRSDNASFQRWRERQKDQAQGDVLSVLRQRRDIGFDDAATIAKSPKCWSMARARINESFNKQAAKLEEAKSGMDADLYQSAKADLRNAHRALLKNLNDLTPRGVFASILDIKLDAFQSLIDAAKVFSIGWDQVDPTVTADDHTVIGSMRLVVYEMPGWLWLTHPLFLIFWGVFFIGCWSLLGGAISRMCVVESANGERIGIPQAVGFAYRRWLAYAIAPLIPLVIVGLFMLAMALIGLLFHAAVLNIIGTLLLIVAIPVGFLMAFFLIGWVGAVHLMYPAISAEGTDAFDGLSRSYSYVLTRPWRFITYTALMLAYGVVTYLFVGLFVFLALYMVQTAMATWAGPVAAVFPKPVLGHLRYEWTGEGLGWSAKIAAALIRVMVMLAVGLVAAYVVSYYFSAYSAIYLLLRGRADGTDPSEIHQEPPKEPVPASTGAPASAGMSSAAPSQAPAESPDKAPDAVEADSE
ncbi:MAG: hypothetical protein ACYC26_06905 [Phycisphaerales bacterium]